MDLVNILFTVFSFIFFIIIIMITYRKGSAKSYDDIANLIIEDDDTYVANNNFNNKSGVQK